MKESKIYEISYLLVPSIPQEKVSEEAAAIMGVLSKASAEVISDEAPTLIPLAYDMTKSTGSGVHTRYAEGYFGWVKFACPSEAIEDVKKSVEGMPSMLRMLLISTIREKTYLGKRARSEAKAEVRADAKVPKADSSEAAPAAATLTPAEIATVDKSIDEMVKGA